MARYAYRGVKYIKSMINCEKKFYDVGPFTVNPNSGTATVSIVSNNAQGNDVGNRSGNSILCKALYARMLLSGNTGVITNLRMLVVKDIEGTGSIPGITDILQSNSILSPLNVDTTPRWQVLRDKTFTLSSGVSFQKQVKLYIKINDHLKYTGPLQSDIYKNQLYVCFVCDQPLATQPSCSITSRMSFYDN